MAQNVNIIGSLYDATSGSKLTSGRLYLTPRGFIRSGRDIVAPIGVTYDVPGTGNLSLNLAPSVDGVLYDVAFDPNPADTTQPYQLKSGYFADIWNVPHDYASNVVNASGLLAYWRLAEPSGTSATDTSGNAHTGTYAGTFTLNQTGAVSGSTAVLFNGTSGKMTVSSYNPFNGLSAVTIEGWVKGDGSWSAGIEVIANSGGVGHYIAVNNGKAYGSLKISGSQRTTALASTAALTAVDFYHIVLTWQSGGQLLLYVNGVQVDASASAFSGTLDTAATFSLGCYDPAGTPANFLGGTVDEVAIYNRALTAAEVADHYGRRMFGSINIVTL